MSYWFEEPHTLVLARAQIDLRNPRERESTGRKLEAAIAKRAVVALVLGRKN
jgi:hypothetical protein